MQSPRPGRPKSPEKREAIRRAAVELFMSDGLQRTSMDAIATAAGVSKQTVYSHFDSKDELFRACVCEKVADYGLHPGDLPAHLSLPQALKSFGRQFLELLQDDEVLSMFRLLAGECASYPIIARVFFEAGPDETRRSIATLLTRFAERGEIAITDPLESASLLIALFQGRYFLELLLGVRETIDEPELESHLDRSVQRFLSLHQRTSHSTHR